MPNLKKSQNQEILDFLKAGNSITSWEAFMRFKVTRLSGRIYDIEEMIKNTDLYMWKKNDTNPENKKKFTRYWLEHEPQPTEHESITAQNNLTIERRINMGERQEAWF